MCTFSEKGQYLDLPGEVEVAIHAEPVTTNDIHLVSRIHSKITSNVTKKEQDQCKLVQVNPNVTEEEDLGELEVLPPCTKEKEEKYFLPSNEVEEVAHHAKHVTINDIQLARRIRGQVTCHVTKKEQHQGKLVQVNPNVTEEEDSCQSGEDLPGLTGKEDQRKLEKVNHYVTEEEDSGKSDIVPPGMEGKENKVSKLQQVSLGINKLVRSIPTGEDKIVTSGQCPLCHLNLKAQLRRHLMMIHGNTQLESLINTGHRLKETQRMPIFCDQKEEFTYKLTESTNDLTAAKKTGKYAEDSHMFTRHVTVKFRNAILKMIPDAKSILVDYCKSQK